MSGGDKLRKYPPILFDEARRREFLDPHTVVEIAGVQNGDHVADFGAGAGFFTVPLAESAAPSGHVYALDINPNNLSIIRGKLGQYANAVELVEADIQTGHGIDIPAASLDVVMLSSVLSQFSDHTNILKLAYDLLKPSGRLVVTEWHARDMLLGPPPDARIAKEDVLNMLLTEMSGWKLRKDIDAGFYHYCLVFGRDG